jgi:hypothetical protein
MIYILTFPVGGREEKAFWVHKDSPWFTMVKLEAGTVYIVKLYTIYFEVNPVRSDPTIFNFTSKSSHL